MAEDDGVPQTDSFARRRYLAMLSLAGALAVAGCTASNDGRSNASTDRNGSVASNETDPGSAPPGEVHDALFRTMPVGGSTDQYDWNPTLTGDLPDARRGIFAQWTQYLFGEDEFHPHLIEDWEHGDGELVLTLSESFTWGNSGDPVTASDLVLQLSVYEAAGKAAVRFVEDAAATGEYELTVQYPRETSEALIEYTLLPILADVPPSNWRGADWADDPTSVTISEPDPSGPLAVTERDDPGLVLSVRNGLAEYHDHALGDQFDWRGYRLRPLFAETSLRQLLIAGELDGVSDLYVSSDTSERFPSELRELRQPAGFGMGLWFDHDRAPWGDRTVRKAFLHTIDADAAIEAAGPSTKRRRTPPTGLPVQARDRWLDAEVREELTDYRGGPSRGEALLADAGFSPADVDVTVAYPSIWSDWASACRTVVDQLAGAGWNVGTKRISGPPDEALDTEFDVLAYPHTPSNDPRFQHPFFSLGYVLRGEPGADEHFANYAPGTVSVGDEAVDVLAELDRLASTSPRTEQRPIVERLVRAINEDVPCAFVMESVDQSFVDTSRFALPEESPHLRTHWPQWWLPKVEETLPGSTRPGLLKYDGD